MKPKAKAKTVLKPKAKATTVGKPKAKATTVGKPKVMAHTVLKGTTKPSQLPSQPATRIFSPITWGPCTIYHGGKQRKYRLKESYASSTSFNDWAKMMTYIRTL